MTGWLEFLLPVSCGAATALLVGVLARLATRSPPARGGWRYLRPGAMHWTGVLLGGGLVGLMLYVRLFVGSNRADAASQMAILSGLIAAFASLSMVCLWQMTRIARVDVHWRGRQIAYRNWAGERVVAAMSDVVAMRRRWNGAIMIDLADGTVLAIDEYSTSAPDLVARIMEVGDGSDPAA